MDDELRLRDLTVRRLLCFQPKDAFEKLKPKEKEHILCHAPNSLTPSIGVKRPPIQSGSRSLLISRDIMGVGPQPPPSKVKTPSITQAAKYSLPIRRSLISKAL